MMAGSSRWLVQLAFAALLALAPGHGQLAAEEATAPPPAAQPAPATRRSSAQPKPCLRSTGR
jgi:hypothetical protein